MKPRASANVRVVHVASNNVRSPVSAERISAAAVSALKAEHVARAALSITMLSARAMAALNKKHLNHAGATDVITFALGTDPSDTLTADIYICPDVARAQAKTHGAGVREEILRLVVHGVLHACGHDHPVDDTRIASPMWIRQEALLRRFLQRELAVA